MHIFEMVFYTAVTLGVLIFIHEFGHFFAAKLTGMRVDRFSIGFPPRAFGKKIGDTDYCVSWIPIGGYVKIAGMIDESMDTEFINQAPQTWEFRSKSLWARMTVISAGVIMNVLLAIAIFTGIHFKQGSYIAETTDIGFVPEGSAFEKAGLLVGDKILAINGKSVTHWEEVQQQIYIENLGNDLILNVARKEKKLQILIPSKSMPRLSDTQPLLIVGHIVAVVEAVEPNMPASKLGLIAGDTIISINDTLVDQPRAISMINKNAGKKIEIKWKRGDKILGDTTTVTSKGRIGITVGSHYIGPSRHINYSIAQAFIEGIKDIGQSVHLFLLTFSKVFAGKATVKESLGGPVAIAQLATQSAEMGFLTFIWFMAQLSMSLAILNILPIPALDGGHLIILLYEKIFHRELSSKVKIAIQQVGFILLLAFMAFIIYNDLTRF